MTTNLETQGGMHIESDPKTGAIAASNAAAVEEEIKAPIPEEKTEEQKIEEVVDPRKAIMAKIYENRGEQFKRELDYAAAVSNGATVDPIIEDEPVEQIETKEAPEPKEEAKPEPQQVASPAKRAITVNGQQLELTEAEIEQLAQRAIYENQTRQQQQQPVQQQAQQPQQQATTQQSDQIKDILKDISRRITYGSEEESAKALGDFAALTANFARSQTIAPEQIVAAATQNALQQIEYNNNLRTIADEYKDIYESRAKSIAAADRVGTLRHKYQTIGIQKPDLEIWREACSDVRAELGGISSTVSESDKTKKVDQQVTAQMNPSRIERKRSAPQPASGVNKVQAMQEQNTALTGSNVVAAMRKARGQPAA